MSLYSLLASFFELAPTGNSIILNTLRYDILKQNNCFSGMLLKQVTGTGDREPVTVVWERVYSGNPPENSTWRTKEKRKQFGEM